MLELNQWFFVLLLNFLVLIYILNVILFKPLLKFLRHRDDSIKDSLNMAKEMEKRKEDSIATLNKELTGARNKAKEIFEKTREEGLIRQKEIFEAANKEAYGLIENARVALKAEAEKARQGLRSDIDRLSEEIVSKIIRT